MAARNAARVQEDRRTYSVKYAASVKKFFKTNIVFIIALMAAAVSCFFIPPDKTYLGYFDYKTLTSLFCMLLIICAIRNIYFFRILAKKIIKLFKTTRSSIMALVFITYFASMVIANDMALITFLPLGIIVLNSTGKQKYMIFTFIMQNIAANLGGMLTPFGNPQNLYLYNYFNIPTAEFFSIMAVPFVVAFVMIFVCCMFIPREKLELTSGEFEQKLDIKRAIIYFILFVYILIIVFRLIPFWAGFFILPVVILLDKKAIFQVDYLLLLTFALFFIFAGNFARINLVKRVLGDLTASNALLTGVISCQLISNVPSAVLLAPFTTSYKSLLMAVNIGGCGTLISSLASLITFKEFAAQKNGKTGKYILWFSVINFLFLIVLTGVCLLL